MRKFFIILLVCLIPVVALAHSFSAPDVASLSDEDLAELNRQVQLELFSRSLSDGIVLSSGVYTVGEDFPSGSYRIIYNEITTNLITYKSMNDYYDLSPFDVYTFFSENGNVEKLTLPEGWSVEIDGSLIFYPYTGIIH